MAKKSVKKATKNAGPRHIRPAPMVDSKIYQPNVPRKSPAKLFATLAILLIAVAGLSFALFGGGPKVDYTEFTTCVADQGVKLYGAYWCPNCAKVKRTLGEAYSTIPYIECDPNGENAQPDLCLQKNIQLYHTFEYSDGTLGVRDTPVQLSQKTGCSLPEGAPTSWRG